jgi:Ohr subfamily peroxiredoxin
MNNVYTATVINTGGRGGGRSVASGSSFAVDIAPPGSKGGSPQATNPEELFAAGYSACFNSAINAALRDAGVKYKTSQVTATVHLLKDPDTGYALAVELKVAIDDFSQADNQKFADLAHGICPYSKATRGYIQVTVIGA